jgi:hypothetical protein
MNLRLNSCDFFMVTLIPKAFVKGQISTITSLEASV